MKALYSGWVKVCTGYLASCIKKKHEKIIIISFTDILSKAFSKITIRMYRRIRCKNLYMKNYKISDTYIILFLSLNNVYEVQTKGEHFQQTTTLMFRLEFTQVTYFRSCRTHRVFSNNRRMMRFKSIVDNFKRKFIVWIFDFHRSFVEYISTWHIK